MKLAVFFPASLFSAWACSYGLVECLRRMGHEVAAIGIRSADCDVVTPSVDFANDIGPIEGIIVSGPEHLKTANYEHSKSSGPPLHGCTKPSNAKTTVSST